MARVLADIVDGIGRLGLGYHRDRANYVVVATAVVYAAAFNVSSFIAVEGRLRPDRLVNTLVCALLFFTLLSLSRRLFAAGTVLAFGATAVIAYYMHTFRIKVSPHVWSVVLETNYDEASGLVGAPVFIWLFAALGAAGLAAWLVLSRLAFTALAPRLALCAVLAAGCGNAIRMGNTESMGMPATFVTSYLQYRAERAKLEALARNRRDVSALPAAARDRDLDVVFIIGEAARPDHFHANGYARQTSPRLEAAGAIPFPRTRACHTATRFAVPCMITRTGADPASTKVSETSFISVFKRLGFATAWISNQGFLGFHETPVSVLAKEAAVVKFANPTGNYKEVNVHDAELLPFLDAFLAGEGRGRLAVLHAIGSHWKYDRHYPAAFRAFTPTCDRSVQKDCAREHVINSYDNTILYADWFAGEVIARLKDRDAIVIFASDHGESLGENGVYAHWAESKNTREQLDAALFVWVSDERERRHPGVRERLRRNARGRVTQPQLFHTVLDCAGVEGEAIDKRKSLCN